MLREGHMEVADICGIADRDAPTGVVTVSTCDDTWHL